METPLWPSIPTPSVMYTITDPAGEYVYMALESGWRGMVDGGDYTKFIAEHNCALYKVKIEDNSYSCVMEGIELQNGCGLHEGCQWWPETVTVR